MINEQLFFKWADKKIGQPIVKGNSKKGGKMSKGYKTK